MMEPLLLERVRQRPDDVLLPDQRREIPRSPLAGEHLIGHDGILSVGVAREVSLRWFLADARPEPEARCAAAQARTPSPAIGRGGFRAPCGTAAAREGLASLTPGTCSK